jgi:outer membrane receptor for ferrienterochelin and colicins
VRYRGEGRTSGEALGSLSGAYRVDDSWLALDTSLHHRPGIPLDEARPDLLAPAWTSSLVGLRAGAKPTRDIELKLKARWVRDYSDGVSSETVPGVPRLFITDLPQTTDHLSLRAQETLQLGAGKRLDFSLARSWYFDSSALDRRDSPLDEQRSRKLLNQGLEAVLTIPEGRSRTWVLGVRSDAERFEQSLDRTLRDLSVEHVTEIQSTLLASGAVYGQLGWKVTERWTVMPGLRAELHDSYGAVAAPRLASAYQLNEVFSARAALGRGFRAPSAKEYGFLFDHSALGYRVLGNPNLQPETSWGATADVSARTAKLRARVGGFFNRVKDLIIMDLAGIDTADGVTEYVYQNVDEAMTAGADLSLRYKVLPQLSLEGGYAYVWTRDIGADEPLPNRPPETITLAAYVELGKLTGNVRYRCVTSAFAGTIEEGEGERDLYTPTFGTLDARLAYQFVSPLEVYVGGLNLTDAKRNPLDPADTRPAQGRQFYVGFRGELPSDLQ